MPAENQAKVLKMAPENRVKVLKMVPENQAKVLKMAPEQTPEPGGLKQTGRDKRSPPDTAQGR